MWISPVKILDRTPNDIRAEGQIILFVFLFSFSFGEHVAHSATPQHSGKRQAVWTLILIFFISTYLRAGWPSCAG